MIHEPHRGRTLSHLIFFNRQVSQAVKARFLGYVAATREVCCIRE